MRSRWYAGVLIWTPIGVVVVRESPRDPETGRILPGPRYFKCPGGHEEPEDGGDPRKTALRELEEETGIRLDIKELTYVAQEWREHPKGNHWFYFFVAVLKSPRADEALFGGDLKTHGDHGEKVDTLYVEEFLVSLYGDEEDDSDILPSQAKIIKTFLELGLISSPLDDPVPCCDQSS